MQVRDRDLGGRDQVVARGRLEEVGLELRQLAGAEERVGVDEERRQDFGVALLLDVDVEDELDEGARQPRGGSAQHREPRAGDLRAALEVEDSEGRPEVPVRLRREVELPRRSPGALDAIRRLVAAARHRRVRGVRHAPLHCREETVGLLGALLERVDLLLERLHLHERLGRRLALDGRELVAPPPLLLELRHGFAPLAIEPRVVFEPGARVAFGHLGEKSLRVLAQELAW